MASGRLARRSCSLVFVVAVMSHFCFHVVLHGSYAVPPEQRIAAPERLAAPETLPSVTETLPSPSPPPPPAAAATTPPAQHTEAIASDMTTCQSSAPSCLPCVRIKPRKPPADSGVRCVWCGSANVCRGYLKGGAFPCTDALRGGGGYPGGRHCTTRRTTPAVAVDGGEPASARGGTGTSELLRAPPLGSGVGRGAP
jgi:hypothetical protein